MEDDEQESHPLKLQDLAIPPLLSLEDQAGHVGSRKKTHQAPKKQRKETPLHLPDPSFPPQPRAAIEGKKGKAHRAEEQQPAVSEDAALTASSSRNSHDRKSHDRRVVDKPRKSAPGHATVQVRLPVTVMELGGSLQAGLQRAP